MIDNENKIFMGYVCCVLLEVILGVNQDYLPLRCRKWISL